MPWPATARSSSPPDSMSTSRSRSSTSQSSSTLLHDSSRIERMDDLKQFLRSALNTRIEALETAATTMEADPVGALATIRRLAHSLRGSGATYGYPQITEAATAVEEAEPEDVPPLLRELVKVLKTVVTELRPAKEQKQAETATDSVPAADDTQVAGEASPTDQAPP